MESLYFINIITRIATLLLALAAIAGILTTILLLVRQSTKKRIAWAGAATAVFTLLAPSSCS